MKKFLLLILIVSLVFTIVSCASEQMDDSVSESTAETTTTSNTTTTETTEESTTTINHPYGGTGGLPSDDTTATTETTATDPMDRYNLGLEYIMDYEAFIITDGEQYEPYSSTVYYQNPYMTGDGILMFLSMENQLPHWIADDMIPEIPINTSSEVSFDYHEAAELKHSGKFRIYIQNEDRTVTKVAELLGSSLPEVYDYCKGQFDGMTVYITYPFLLKTGDYSALTDGIWGDEAVHDIMCIFKTTF